MLDARRRLRDKTGLAVKPRSLKNRLEGPKGWLMTAGRPGRTV
ncbi:hypothetical protein DVDV_0294 [Desulfovibrio sp. DV]|nr:hypothetical protein DVDV_0294 [Desulfovibrio sp. DV]